MRRFAFLRRAAWLCLICLAPHGTTVAADLPRPNIVFILADDLGYGDLGCYGQKKIRTPRIDHLAAEGVRFTQCYAGSTVCAPSRCTLMTGRHTGHARVRGNGLVPLLPEDVTVAEVLHEAGYTTAMFGKWGLGEPGTSGLPNRQGFDEWFGYLNQGHAHDYYPTYLWHNEERIELSGNSAGKREQYSADLITEHALAFLSEHHDETFFLYLPFSLPHANNELGRETGNGMQVPDDRPYSDEPWPAPQRNHAAMITRLDDAVGRVLDLIEELGLTERTIVFFSSDNGPHQEGGADPAFFASAGPLRGHKRDLYEGGIRTPMIVRWPGQIEPGTTSDTIWAFWDFLPTAAELAGTTPPPGIDGVSAVPALLVGTERPDRPPAKHTPLYWEFHERGFQQAVRQENWKGIRRQPGKPLELYDLSTDLAEQRDVAAVHPEVATELAAELEKARTESAEWPVRRP